MKTHWLDTSAVVTLHFRSAALAQDCRNCIPSGARTVISWYALFELARGFLARLRGYYNESYECKNWSSLRKLVKTGPRDRTYEGRTWRDMLDDIEERIEEMVDSDPDYHHPVNPWTAPEQRPGIFRSMVSMVVDAGWHGCTAGQEHGMENPAGCRDDLKAPYLDETGLLQHDLPGTQCGQPGNCGVLAFVQRNAAALKMVRDEDWKRRDVKEKQGERTRRREGLEHLLSASEAETFVGKRCHHCGDAMIAMEATAEGGCAVTKDKEFPRLCKALGGTAPVMVKHTA